MTTAADHLRAHSARLLYLLNNTPLDGESADAVNRARRVIDLCAADLACEKVRLVEPAQTVADARATALERALPRRPWAAYATAALACYLAGALTSLAVVGAL